MNNLLYCQKNTEFFIKLSQQEQNNLLNYFYSRNQYIFKYFYDIYVSIHAKKNTTNQAIYNQYLKYQSQKKHEEDQQRRLREHIQKTREQQAEILRQQSKIQEAEILRKRHAEEQQRAEISRKRHAEEQQRARNSQQERALQLQQRPITVPVPKPQPQPQSQQQLVPNRFYSMSDLIKGRNVVIVGPASSIIGKGKGDFIESFHCVVRLNQCLPLPPKHYVDIGRRTDILYNNLNTADFPNENKLNLALFYDAGVRIIASPYPPIPPFAEHIQKFILYNRGIYPLHIVDIQLYIQICQQIGTRPNTGLMAIFDTLSMNPKHLHICGMTFFKDGYYKEYRNINAAENLRNIERIHKQSPQIDLLKTIYLMDNRISVDSVLENILMEQFIKVGKNVQTCNADLIHTRYEKDKEKFYKSSWILRLEKTDNNVLFIDLDADYMDANIKKIIENVGNYDVIFIYDPYHLLNNTYYKKIKHYSGKIIIMDFPQFDTKFKKNKRYVKIKRMNHIEKDLTKILWMDNYNALAKFMDHDDKDKFNTQYGGGENIVVANKKLFALLRDGFKKVGFKSQQFIYIIFVVLFYKNNYFYISNAQKHIKDMLWIKYFEKYKNLKIINNQ